MPVTVWLSTHWADLAVIFLLTVAVILAVLRIIRNRREGKTSCGGQCENCAAREFCRKTGRSE